MVIRSRCDIQSSAVMYLTAGAGAEGVRFRSMSKKLKQRHGHKNDDQGISLVMNKDPRLQSLEGREGRHAGKERIWQLK